MEVSRERLCVWGMETSQEKKMTQQNGNISNESCIQKKPGRERTRNGVGNKIKRAEAHRRFERNSIPHTQTLIR